MSQHTDPAQTPSVAWLSNTAHRQALFDDAVAQLGFFAPMLRPDGGFDVLSTDARPLPRTGQEIHTTTRAVHSYVLGHQIGFPDAERIVDAGMDYLWASHRDEVHGGYVWGCDAQAVTDGRKLAYGHVFVLLAASSARLIGHPDADRLLGDVSEVIDQHYWDDANGRLNDEFTRDWQQVAYCGMNSNMHGVEAMLAAYEATGETLWLDRAGRILQFFTNDMARRHDWRIPEHYDLRWQPDDSLAGDPIFRPAGTTPGHSLEWARLLLQHWDLAGQPDADAPARARALIHKALDGAWRADGGFVYTLKMQDGKPDVATRFWWPVTEGLGAVAALLKLGDPMETWYGRLWQFAQAHLIDHQRGGWFPELDEAGRPAATQFPGKPDIYHALQAVLYPLTPGLSRPVKMLAHLPELNRASS